LLPRSAYRQQKRSEAIQFSNALISGALRSSFPAHGRWLVARPTPNDRPHTSLVRATFPSNVPFRGRTVDRPRLFACHAPFALRRLMRLSAASAVHMRSTGIFRRSPLSTETESASSDHRPSYTAHCRSHPKRPVRHCLEVDAYRTQRPRATLRPIVHPAIN
jgi:hypothetical protein